MIPLNWSLLNLFTDALMQVALKLYSVHETIYTHAHTAYRYVRYSFMEVI